MPLSVGGRFSLWSAASLACMIYLGPDNFRKILNGAHEMDEHVRTTPLEQNAAMRLALLDYWNTSLREKPMRVLLAYANRPRLLPTYLQQLEMESNGKSVDSGQCRCPADRASALGRRRIRGPALLSPVAASGVAGRAVRVHPRA